MGKCACVMTGYESATDDFCFETKIKSAKKRHRCWECGSWIEQGQGYRRLFNGCDGNVFTVKMCNDCASIMDLFFCRGIEFGNMWDALREHIRDMDGKILCDEVSKLPINALEKVIKMIEEYWERYCDDDE